MRRRAAVPVSRAAWRSRKANLTNAETGMPLVGILWRWDERIAQIGLAGALIASAVVAADSASPCGAGRPRGYLDVSGSKIYYEECGSGAAVVLLHDGL